MTYRILLNELDKLSSRDESCRKVYCSTCGGLSAVVENRMTPEFRIRIADILSSMTMDDLLYFGEWVMFLDEVDSQGVSSIYEREAQVLDSHDIRKLDSFLFNARRMYKSSLVYDELLAKGIQKVIETPDNSLIETVALVLSSDIVNYNSFLSLAKSRSNKAINRVLYNTIREIDPSVRAYDKKV